MIPPPPFNRRERSRSSPRADRPRAADRNCARAGASTTPPAAPPAPRRAGRRFRHPRASGAGRDRFRGGSRAARRRGTGQNDRCARRAARRRLLAHLVALVRVARDCARGEPGVRLHGHALRVAIAQRRDAHARRRKARRALEEHQRDRRVDEFDRRMRHGGKVRRAVRILVADRARRAVRIERRAERRAPECRAMAHQRIPLGRPAEIADGGARETEGKIEAADPRPGRASSRSNARQSCRGSIASSRNTPADRRPRATTIGFARRGADVKSTPSTV